MLYDFKRGEKRERRQGEIERDRERDSKIKRERERKREEGVINMFRSSCMITLVVIIEFVRKLNLLTSLG